MATDIRISWSSSTKSYTEGRITKIRKFNFRYFFARRKFIEDQNTIAELSGRVQELQNKVIVWTILKIFQDLESVRSGKFHVTSRPVSFTLHPILQGMLRHSFFLTPSRSERPLSIWDTHGFSGKVFANPDASSSALYSQELHRWNSSEKPQHSSTVEESGRPERDQDLRCQSGPSAKDSVIFSGGDSSKNYGADQQWLQISDLHFDKFPRPATLCLQEDKVQDRGMYLFTIPHGSDAMDQRSGVGWFSGWIEIFVIYPWYFNAEFWSIWCEDCFSAEQDHP